jgi:hypothetical protein
VVAEAAALILALAHLLDNYSVPPLWRDTKLFGRKSYWPSFGPSVRRLTACS